MKHMKSKITALAALCLPALRLSAADVLPGPMQGLAQSIYDTMTGDFVKIILAIFLCGSAIAYGFNKDNEKIKRNALAIGIAAAILISASTIVGAVWSASGGK